MLRASAAFTTAPSSTLQRFEILRFRLSLSGASLRHTMMSGWMPRLRSSVTECWVGLVFCSPEGPMKGTSVTWM
ncbi:unannotated protein [freshwater metagenome]|uniref:Unannotated protein n=1 Tax=freshwater metagenome TaxID=449393 RepID=A0A6J6GP13_9ZZZZ